MHEDRVRHHIAAALGPRDEQARRMTSSIANLCWPAGGDDRSEPAALPWVRLWRPDRDGATIPVCSCHAGRCAVCN